MKKKYLIFLIITFLFCNLSVSLAQTDSSEDESVSVEDRVDEILQELSELHQKLKNRKGRENHLNARKIKLIKRKLIRAVNSIPPDSCLEQLKSVMNEIYELLSEHLIGISCGPNLTPPFLQQIDLSLTPDCILPPDLEINQLDDIFVDLNPIYDSAQDLSIIDLNENEISDVCEGD